MPYATQDDLVLRHSEETVAELSGSDRGTEIDEDRVAAALEDAHAEVDAFLAVRFPVVPLDPPPAGLKAVVCDIAIYRLMALRPKGDVEDARGRYKDALKTLASIASSHQGLAGAPVTNPVKNANPTSRFNDSRMSLFLGWLR